MPTTTGVKHAPIFPGRYFVPLLCQKTCNAQSWDQTPRQECTQVVRSHITPVTMKAHRVSMGGQEKAWKLPVVPCTTLGGPLAALPLADCANGIWRNRLAITFAHYEASETTPPQHHAQIHSTKPTSMHHKTEGRTLRRECTPVMCSHVEPIT
jgi:hypothetical protein